MSCELYVYFAPEKTAILIPGDPLYPYSLIGQAFFHLILLVLRLKLDCRPNFNYFAWRSTEGFIASYYLNDYMN